MALTSNGSPSLPGAIARFECIPYANHAGSDHEIFIGAVTRFVTAGTTTPPLIFHASKYCNLTPVETVQAPPDFNMWLHGW